MVWRCSYGVVNCEVCRRTDLSASAKRLKCFEEYNKMVPFEHRAYLTTRYSEKNVVKALGARWDAERRQWYADKRAANLAEFARWVPTKRPALSAGKRIDAAPASRFVAEVVSAPVQPAPVREEPLTFSFDDILAATGNVDARCNVAVRGEYEMEREVIMVTNTNNATRAKHA